ncbi:MAG: iron dependent repressor, metal binding and dimerization domain protein [Candidatus Limiplasma sp.]|nr:iron dependent repressor, metal binding and dimerization domain protein [Candidatus Limiplasma sp.]
MDKTTGAGFRTVRGYQLANRSEGRMTPALEDYLEMVYRLSLESGYARVGKLSGALHVKPSSASKMIFRLVDLGYLEYDRYDSILLTGKGKEKGAYLLKRHDIVERFLGFIGNPNPLEEAELVEHSLERDTVFQLQILLAFFTQDGEAKRRYEAFREKAWGSDSGKP